ncbi:hypothetical protein QBC32DRAFT_387235 [Pseudoneurospora amorphoporcata]|uniref:MaoC-like domain-containing protein n=1 Tax=Pseudoneurospora amorphoporcata TaxID=241081 RepID=A0AAN6NX18_9PEZI|nr:hypothetical protein QBC32DRAFT_387235 [Pseudoneurospora amorphoporcata]
MRLFTPTTRTIVTTTRAVTMGRFLAYRVPSTTRLPRNTTAIAATNQHGSHITACSSENGPPSPPPPFNPETYPHQATTTLSSIPPKLIPDTLHPTQSHLLSLALFSHLPSVCLPAGFVSSHNNKSPSRSSSSSQSIFPWPTTQYQAALPPGYHLIHYPLQTPPHLLFPDGTDADHCPGAPFTRRMWAGGRIEFAKGADQKFTVDGRKTVCVETLGEPVAQLGKGGAGSEQEQRVWVDVWRTYVTFPPEAEGVSETEMERVVAEVNKYLEQSSAMNTSTEPSKPKEGVISELRRLVFLRERQPPIAGQHTLEPAPARVIRVPHTPDFSFTMTPDATLLFQFSALTFNAHAIHLDPLYAREVEGYKERLVHGPLTLVVMLRGVEGFLNGASTSGATGTGAGTGTDGTQISEAIKERLFVPERESQKDGKRKQWEIANIEYKNLRPLFVGEEMKVCVRLLPNKQKNGDKASLGGPRRERVDVWIEAPDEGLAVKGTVGVEWR